MEQIQACSCGYKPKSDSIEKFTYCTETRALKNHITFPSFEFLSDVNNPSEFFFKLEEDNIVPKRHWAFLIEIDENLNSTVPAFCGHTRYGERVKVEFHHEPDDKATSFSWSDIQKENTMAILYCEKKTLNGEMVICQEVLDCCYIFKANLEQIEREASKLLDLMDSKHLNKQPVCFNCGSQKEDLIECDKCKMALYCCQECHGKASSMDHKNLCHDSDVLLRLATLPRHGEFMDYYSFVQKSFDYLPEYFFSEQFVQHF